MSGTHSVWVASLINPKDLSCVVYFRRKFRFSDGYRRGLDFTACAFSLSLSFRSFTFAGGPLGHLCIVLAQFFCLIK